jgi:hypothetical protein
MGFACPRCGSQSACDPYYHLKLLASLSADSAGNYRPSSVSDAERRLIGHSEKSHPAARTWLSADRLLGNQAKRDDEEASRFVGLDQIELWWPTEGRGIQISRPSAAEGPLQPVYTAAKPKKEDRGER